MTTTRYRRRSVLALVAASLAGVPAARAADPVDRFIAELEGARSFKVRIHAAALLARTRDPRAVPALARASERDRDPVVREIATRLLGENPGGDPGGQVARRALERAGQDPAPVVRRAAESALVALQATLAAKPSPKGVGAKPAVAVAVRSIGDKTGRAAPALRDRMRTEVLTSLRGARGVSVADNVEAGQGFVVDGTVSRLEHVQGKTDVEITAAVELVVSRPPRGIVMVATGEATVQRPRVYYKPEQKKGLEAEAVTHAVRSAHENLARFLATAQ